MPSGELKDKSKIVKIQITFELFIKGNRNAFERNKRLKNRKAKLEKMISLKYNYSIGNNLFYND